MDNLQFLSWMKTLYGTFGKAASQAHVVDAAYRRVEGMPDAFFTFALEKLEDLDALPQNLGRELRTVLWPEYLAAHPEKRSYADTCPECNGQGAIIVRIADPQGRPGYGRDRAFRCVCAVGNDEGWTWGRIRERYELEQPDPVSKERAIQGLARFGIRLGEIRDSQAYLRRDRDRAEGAW